MTASDLAQLERAKAVFGPGSGVAKLDLLRRLARSTLPTAKAVLRLHEALCFLRAHPDDESVLAQVETMLADFALRRDLRRHRRALADSGIAGTTLRYSFFANTARWLSRRFPGALRVVWRGYTNDALLSQRLPLFASWPETPGLDEVDLPANEWVRRLAGPGTSDADFLVERCARLGATEQERETFFEELELDFELDLVPAGGLPTRSTAHLPGRPVHFQSAPLRRERPDLRAELRRRHREIQVDESTGASIVTLAREAMVLRHRDLDAFAYGDPRDVRLFDCGDGLEFAVIGMKPERRLLLEAVHAYVTLKNGVPIGYVLTSGLFGSSEVAYNVFDTWRGGEAGLVYGRVLGVTKQLYGSDTFTIYPYQLGGEGNTEGLKSGSWWFYQKLGFRARDPGVLALMERELAAMAKGKGHRSSIATLKALAEHNVYWSAGRARDDVIGVFPLANIGLAITDLLAKRFGADRERGEDVCADEAADLCAVRGFRKWDENEQLWWRRWSPLILLLPGITSWTAAQRCALVDVVRKKGGRRESDYVRLLDAHRPLRRALRQLAIGDQRRISKSERPSTSGIS
ncbi:MAG: hypothetical protein JNK78_07160 [Planctomycetes bacterium]|nr:hypothetical protein [Planctomycetota bacterium]